MPIPSKCDLQFNISWEPSSYKADVKIYFSFLEHLHLVSKCIGFVNSSWVWLQGKKKWVLSRVLRRGGKGYVHLNDCCVSGCGAQAQAVTNQGMQKCLPVLVSLSLLPGPFSQEEEKWKNPRDLWSPVTSLFTVGSNRDRSAGLLSLPAKCG